MNQQLIIFQNIWLISISLEEILSFNKGFCWKKLYFYFHCHALLCTTNRFLMKDSDNIFASHISHGLCLMKNTWTRHQSSQISSKINIPSLKYQSCCLEQLLTAGTFVGAEVAAPNCLLPFLFCQKLPQSRMLLSQQNTEHQDSLACLSGVSAQGTPVLLVLHWIKRNGRISAKY